MPKLGTVLEIVGGYEVAAPHADGPLRRIRPIVCPRRATVAT